MEVVLLENIKNLGNIGDVVVVKRGHGRNFLIKLPSPWRRSSRARTATRASTFRWGVGTRGQ